jgi:hypothetical protein
MLTILDTAVITLHCRTGRRAMEKVGWVGAVCLGLVLIDIQLRRTHISLASYCVGTVLVGGIFLVELYLAVGSLRSFKVRLWPDRLTYHHLRGKLTVQKADIVAVGYDRLPPPSKQLLLMLAGRRFVQPRLFVKTVQGQRVWLEEFWVPPPTATGKYARRARAEQGEVLATMSRWVEGRGEEGLGPEDLDDACPPDALDYLGPGRGNGPASRAHRGDRGGRLLLRCGQPGSMNTLPR